MGEDLENKAQSPFVNLLKSSAVSTQTLSRSKPPISQKSPQYWEMAIA